MDQKNFLLHYPDGRVAASLLEGMRPDAFLFEDGIWISFKMRFEIGSYRNAIEQVVTTSISGYPCRLLCKASMQKFLKNFREINSLRERCGFTAIPFGYFWVAGTKELPYRLSLKLDKNGSITQFVSMDKLTPLSFAVAGTDVYKCLAQKHKMPITESYVEIPESAYL